MPLYEYKCEHCNMRFEKYFSKIHEKKEEKCLSCGKMAGRLMSSFSFKFNESKKIPKEIDKVVGSDAEKRWMLYEERKNKKEKLRKELNDNPISRDIESGEYTPLTITNTETKEILDKNDAVKFRKQAITDCVETINQIDEKS